MRLVLAALVAFGAAGCFDTPTPECAFACGPGGDCPDGYRCAPDNLCKRDDVDDEFDCPGIDAPVDAGVDASS